MDKNDTIVVIGIGGALGLILWLASKNQNKADEVYMPYGWGSFQNSDNPLTPITPSPIPTPTPPDHGAGIGEPWNGFPWGGNWELWNKWKGDWAAYQAWLRGGGNNPPKNPIDTRLQMIPIVPKQMDKFAGMPSYKTVIKPVIRSKVT